MRLEDGLVLSQIVCSVRYLKPREMSGDIKGSRLSRILKRLIDGEYVRRISGMYIATSKGYETLPDDVTSTNPHEWETLLKSAGFDAANKEKA